MSRVGVMEILSSDPGLNGMGIDQDRIWPNFALDVAPRSGGPWLVLRWGSLPARPWRGTAGSQQSLTVWAYQSRQVTTDFTLINDALALVTAAMLAVDQYVASDGSAISTVDYGGESQDIEDAGYDAIARSVNFTVVTRRVS